MKTVSVCLIVFFDLFLLPVVPDNALAESEAQKPPMATTLKNGAPENEDLSSLATQLWEAFFFADARFRQESLFQQASPNRYRYRMRLRMGGDFPIHSKVGLGFRMVTGATDDPTTGNVDLDHYFSKKSFNLDRLFLRYSLGSWLIVPERRQQVRSPSAETPRLRRWRSALGLSLYIGKFANPFEHVELVFHNDVQFEGAAQQFRFNDVGFIRQVRFNLGQFILDEIKNAPDTNLFAGQLFFEGFRLKGLSLGAALYEYRNENNIAQAVEDGLLAGGDTNARIGAGTGTSAYRFGFRILEGLAKYEFDIESVPFWILGAYAQNLSADDNDRAYWSEIGVGPVSRLHQLRGLYHYVRVEQESMISNYNNADMFNPNVAGHELKFAVPIVKNISAEALYFLARNIIASSSNPYQHKTRLQIKVKF